MILNIILFFNIIIYFYQERVKQFIKYGVEDGAELLLDGSSVQVPGFEKGNFVGATILSLNLKKKLSEQLNNNNSNTNDNNSDEKYDDVSYGLSSNSPLIVNNRAYVEEIFGPVLFCVHVNTLDEAIAFTNNSKYGNGCAIFTQR